MDPNNWEERHRQFSAALDADQVECRAMLQGAANVDAGIQDERIAGIVDDALIEKGNSWEERQVVIEGLSGRISEELTRRAALLNEAYPFLVLNGALRYQRSKTGVYEFCLAVARNPAGVLDGKPRASAIFEFIARDVLALHFGKGFRGFRTGAPVYSFEDRGTGTRSTFIRLNQDCGEFRWDPAPGYPNEPSHQDLKDAGLDVVVWKPWPDSRLAQFFALGQCACGKNDITVSKGRELSLKRLGNWLRPVCHTDPLRCFLAAHHIPNSVALCELSGEAGLVFDRARIALIAETASADLKSPEGIDYHSMAATYASQTIA